MFHIKICGVRLQRDIEAVAAAGADAVGLNFYPKSIRFVDPNDPSTRDLSDEAAKLRLMRVGVFVNESPARTLEIADRIGLDAIQLHGDESVDEYASILDGDQPIIRAIKLPAGPLTIETIRSRCGPWIQAAAALLLDADAGSAHGGSGKQLDWPTIRRWSESAFGEADPEVERSNASWILAGGLHPQNVGEAIRLSGATRVDVASGVESPRGVKTPEKIRQFVKQAAASIARR